MVGTTGNPRLLSQPLAADQASCWASRLVGLVPEFDRRDDIAAGHERRIGVGAMCLSVSVACADAVLGDRLGPAGSVVMPCLAVGAEHGDRETTRTAFAATVSRTVSRDEATRKTVACQRGLRTQLAGRSSSEDESADDSRSSRTSSSVACDHTTAWRARAELRRSFTCPKTWMAFSTKPAMPMTTAPRRSSVA